MRLGLSNNARPDKEFSQTPLGYFSDACSLSTLRLPGWLKQHHENEHQYSEKEGGVLPVHTLPDGIIRRNAPSKRSECRSRQASHFTGYWKHCEREAFCRFTYSEENTHALQDDVHPQLRLIQRTFQQMRRRLVGCRSGNTIRVEIFGR